MFFDNLRVVEPPSDDATSRLSYGSIRTGSDQIQVSRTASAFSGRGEKFGAKRRGYDTGTGRVRTLSYEPSPTQSKPVKPGQTQRQKGAGPEERIVRRSAKSEAGQEIPIFENNEEKNGLRDSNEAKPGTFFGKAAEDAFPDKNQQTRRAERAAELLQRKKTRRSSRQKRHRPTAARRDARVETRLLRESETK